MVFVALAIALLAAAAPARAQEVDWRIDVNATVMAEAWDVNETREAVAGVFAGVDRRVWRGVSVRVEGALLRVNQPGPDAWQGGVLTGVRLGGARRRFRPFMDLLAGVSHATRSVPPSGTRFNYLLAAGAGIVLPAFRSVDVQLGARWLHISNNGLAGRRRNPDIQAVGAFVGVVWTLRSR